MTELDVTPTPSEELLARFVGEYRAAPSEERPRVLEQYIQNHPRYATEIREMASFETVVARARPQIATPGYALQPGQRLGPFQVVRFGSRSLSITRLFSL